MSDEEKVTIKLEKRDKLEKKEKKEKKDKKENRDKKDKKEKLKRKRDDSDASGDDNSSSDEIEIDLNASVPLNKKQQRLLKKGKLDLEKLEKKHPKPKPATEVGKEDAEPKRLPFGVWIGNLSFDTTKEDLVRFIVSKLAEQPTAVTEDDILRVNIPKKENKIKGFAYVDLPLADHVQSVVALSELALNGRKLLIKDLTSFEGRPLKEATALSKNPPLRILFVGNLSFDTLEDNLREHFGHCGEIVRVRMATFEDLGKCKGFAFVDFKDELGPTTALKLKVAKVLINRKLRLEYGEDRLKRAPKRPHGGDSGADAGIADADDHSHSGNSGFEPRLAPTSRDRPTSYDRGARDQAPATKRRRFDDHAQPQTRLKLSVALAQAPRALAAIVELTGKKIKFD